MSLITLLVPYASILTVLVAIIFGTLTLRQWSRARHLASTAELVHTIQGAEFNRAFGLVTALPPQTPVERIQNQPETASAVLFVVHVFESLGILVFHRALTLELVDHLIGGYVRTSWRRLQPYVEYRRSELGVMFGEWFQWLAERLDEYPALGKKEGAHIKFRDWNP